MTARELTSSKGRAALGTTAVVIVGAVADALGALRPEVAITVVVCATVLGVGYMITTAWEDRARAPESKP